MQYGCNKADENYARHNKISVMIRSSNNVHVMTPRIFGQFSRDISRANNINMNCKNEKKKNTNTHSSTPKLHTISCSTT